MKILVTGGAGFIGSNFVRHILRSRPGCSVINFDALTYAGNLESLADVARDPRYRFVRGDITVPAEVESCFDEPVDVLINFAAESHVDRSIEDAGTFVTTNVLGTQILLEASRRRKVARFIQVSTDEVYGSLGERGLFSEESPLRPNSPYAASKTGADLLVRSYHQTFGADVVITRCSNNYGPYQFPEKLIPLMILNALDDKRLPVYGDGLYTRDWIHVSDHCRALDAVLEQGRPGAVYNIGGNQEAKNIDVVRRILEILDKPEDLIEYVTDRPGHDRRYAIDSSLIGRELGWKAEMPFLAEGLEATVRWYCDNRDWVESVRSGDYAGYYQRMYEERDQTLAAIKGAGADQDRPIGGGGR